MRHSEDPAELTARAVFELLGVDDLKPLARLFGHVPPRKGELVEVLVGRVGNREQVRVLYEALDELGQKAVQEAAHNPLGTLDPGRFQAKYGRLPNFGGSGRRHDKEPPTNLRLFFPRYNTLPRDVRELLRGFVPEPPPLSIDCGDKLPTTVKRPHVYQGQYHSKPDETEVELRVRNTARAALHDVKAVLRLVDAGQVRVSDKTRRPSEAAIKAVAGVLADGDFYTATDASKNAWDPSANLTMKPFAWPLIVQAAGLAQLSGTKLQLTPAGRQATAKPAHELIRHAWSRWMATTLIDEFNRVDVIKGQRSGRGGLTAVAPRRQVLVEVLDELPAQKWIAIEELFRIVKVAADGFQVAQEPSNLYICERQYGSLGYNANYSWETLQGRYALAFLFEYAATLGLFDVAYISPIHARNDYCDRWGTDDFSCLSRYDGLMYVRINSLGAWCLGLAETYEPEQIEAEQILRMLPNLEVVATNPPLSPGDALFLDRFAERQSDAVWRLTAAKLLVAVEEGLTIGELRDFLTAKCHDSLPQTVQVFLADLETKATQLEDLGPARLIACRDEIIAHTLASDRRLRALCQLAGDRHLVFRPFDETAVRRTLRELGHVLPPVR